ncbi:MAG: hypothetical protein AB8G22_25220 [Saprospiraceae bacterium]
MLEFIFNIFPLLLLAIFVWQLYPFHPKIEEIKAFYHQQEDPFAQKINLGAIIYGIFLVFGFALFAILFTLQGFNEQGIFNTNWSPIFIFHKSCLLLGTIVFWTWLLANICYQSWKGKVKQPIYYWIIALISWSMLLVFTIRQLFG